MSDPTPPSSSASASSSSSSSSSAPRKTSLAGSVKNVFSSFDVKGVTSDLNRGLHQAVQYAGEKLGTAEVTPLPQEYLALEQRVDRLKAVHENLVKVAALQIIPGAATDIRFAVYGALNNVVDTLGNTPDQTVTSINEKLRNVSVNTQSPSQAMADQFAHAGAALGEEAPLGSALIKASEVHKKIGKARVQMNSDVNDKFIKRLTRNIETTFRNVNNYRRNVNSARLRLDAVKSRAKAATPEKAEQMSDELQLAQSEFNSLVSVTLEIMREAVSTNEPLAALADMMASMLTYFQTGYELLSELAPELDSIKVAQEALSDSPPSKE